MSEHRQVFSSAGLSCSATLFLPEAETPPVIVMGQGFGAEVSFGTAGFVASFVAAGFAVFAFDYRGFGQSEGEPRQLVHPGHHCEDWYNAVQYVRSLGAIDNQQVYLWGSSFAGGHVLVTAARVAGLKGVIAQVPFTRSRGNWRSVSPIKMLQTLLHGTWDALLSLVGLEHRVALVAEPGEGFAVMDWPGWARDYLSIAKGSSTWTNSMPARGLFAIGSYNPVDSAGSIRCPVLIISGGSDQGVARAATLETVEKIPVCQHEELDFDHFDLYDGFRYHDTAVRLQLDFLLDTLQQSRV